MKKIIFTLLLFALMFTASVSAVTHTWQMVCAERGDNFGDLGVSICQRDPTIIGCQCNGACCRLCVNEEGSTGNYAYCSLPSQGCECGDSPVSDLEAPIMNVLVPTEGGVYNTRAINVHITTNENAAIYIKNNLQPALDFFRICAFGQECKRSQAFNEGFNDYTFRAYDWVGNFADVRRTFTIDSVKPLIRSTSPKAGAYVAKTFTVIYDEANPKLVTLNYKETGSSIYKKVTSTTCPSGLNKQCDLTVAANIAQGALDYYICVKDVATEICSPHVGVIVDTVKPTLTVTSPPSITPAYVANSRSVNMNIAVSEFVTLTYTDTADPYSRVQTLCTACSSFNGARNFNDGSHTITVKAKDAAGNEATKQVTFFVDSKAPIISSTLPLKETFGNGHFSVKYSEENLKSVILYYKQNINDAYKTKTGEGCPSGLLSQCNVAVTLLNGDVWFYFKVVDIANQEAVSSVSHIKIDTIQPVLTVENPHDEIYSSRSVPFDITMSDANSVTLEYIDNTELRPQYRMLSRGLTEYHNLRSFIDGPHEIIIRARDPAGNEVNYPWSFRVDSVPPRIIKSSPAMNSFGGKTFTATYMEMNPVGLTLFYKYSGDAVFTKAPTKTDCPGGRTAVCSITIPTLQDNKVVEYYFEITDIAGNKYTQPSVTKFTTDTVVPILTVNSPTTGSSNNYVNFNLGASENVAFEYIDNSATLPRWRRIAANVMVYTNNLGFSNGYHDLQIRAIDPAGNTAISAHIQLAIPGI